MAYAWILVADSNRARLFSAESAGGGLQEFQDMTNPDARGRNQDLNADRPGRSFDSAGQGRHAMGSPIGPKEQEAIRFAHRVAERLEQGRQSGDLGRLHVIAAPAFLGLLRREFGSALNDLLATSIDKDLTHLSGEEIRSQLPERL